MAGHLVRRRAQQADRLALLGAFQGISELSVSPGAASPRVPGVFGLPGTGVGAVHGRLGSRAAKSRPPGEGAPRVLRPGRRAPAVAWRQRFRQVPPELFAENSKVRIKGLVKRPGDNGKEGIVVGYSADKGRYQVRLPRSSKPLNFKPEERTPRRSISDGGCSDGNDERGGDPEEDAGEPVIEPSWLSGPAGQGCPAEMGLLMLGESAENE
ncbi:unnamed protein product, partial [Prorocentrum cordatum]